jgi:pimeloyl-ACP methyl ester carboxylesterase
VNLCAATDQDGTPIHARVLTLRGMEIEYLEAGDGPLILFLHGFPDHLRTWQDMLRRFAGIGYRAVAPSMRGYGARNAAPDGVYRDWATGSDALSLIEALGHERAIIVGHDWGAAATYAAAQLAPSKLDAIVTLAVPFGRALRDAIVQDGDQQRRSWYWYFFQLPFAHDAVAYQDFAFLDRIWAEWSPGYRLGDDEMALLKARFAQAGVLDEVLKYYHQLFQPAPVDPSPAIQESQKQLVSVPTLYLHGRQDGCIGADLGEASAALFAGPYERAVLGGAGHFLHLEQPEAVFDLMTEFIARVAPKRTG